MMPVLATWGFETADGADHAVRRLSQQALHAQILLHDAAIVIWPEGAVAPKALRIRHPRIRGALGKGFWGLLLDSVFGPQLKQPADPASPSLRALSGWSIGQEALSSIRAHVTPGSSALFVVCRADAPDSLDRLEQALPDSPHRLCRVELGRAVAGQPPAARPESVDVTALEDRAAATPENT
jgi:uncharacterized membrane protein